MKSSNKSILYFGILLYLLGFFLTSFFQSNSSYYLPFELIKSTSPIVAFLLLGIVTPAIEELSFRSWAVSKTTFKYISFVGINVYVFIFLPWWLAVVCAVTFALILFRSGFILKALASSLIFGAIHFSNYSGFKEAVFPIIAIIGFGLILSYISQRYTLIHSIVLHILYNSILLAITLSIGIQEDTKIKTNNFIGSIKTQCSYVEKYRFSEEKNNNKTLIEGKLTDIALKLSKSTKDTIYNKKQSSFNCISTIHLSIIKSKLNKSLLINELLQNTPLKADTATIFTKEFQLINPSKTYSIKPDEFYIQNLNLLSDYFKTKFQKDILTPEIYDREKAIYLDMHLLSIKDFDAAANYLKEEYGIEIKESKKTTTVITFYEVL